MDGTWRTKATEPRTIRSVSKVGNVSGGHVDPSLVNGKSKRKGTPAPAQMKGKRRFYR